MNCMLNTPGIKHLKVTTITEMNHVPSLDLFVIKCPLARNYSLTYIANSHIINSNSVSNQPAKLEKELLALIYQSRIQWYLVLKFKFMNNIHQFFPNHFSCVMANGVIEGKKMVLEGPCIWVVRWGIDVLHEERRKRTTLLGQPSIPYDWNKRQYILELFISLKYLYLAVNNSQKWFENQSHWAWQSSWRWHYPYMFT